MTNNPLTMLTEESNQISPDISPAKTAYMLSQLLEYVDYNESESITAAETVSLEEQNDAIKTLASIIANLNSGKTLEESILREFQPDNIKLENSDFVPESVVNFADNSTIDKTTKSAINLKDNSTIDRISEDKEENLNEINHDTMIVLEDEQEDNTEIYEEEIIAYVIPLIMTRLINEGNLGEDSEDREMRIYQSDEFTASLQLTPTEEQILILTRNQQLFSENEVALKAVRNTNYSQFQVTKNQLTEMELEKLKATALMDYNQNKEFDRKEQEL